jgi:hypothetical protein
MCICSEMKVLVEALQEHHVAFPHLKILSLGGNSAEDKDSWLAACEALMQARSHLSILWK